MNVSKYREQKGVNNKFLSSYKKLIPPPEIYQPNNCDTPQHERFADLIKEYEKNRYHIPDNYQFKNIFKRTPMLNVNKMDMNNFYISKKEMIDSIKDLKNDKSLKALKNYNNIVIELIDQIEQSAKVRIHEKKKASVKQENPPGQTNEVSTNIDDTIQIRNEIINNKKEIKKIKYLLSKNMMNSEKDSFDELINQKFTLWCGTSSPSTSIYTNSKTPNPSKVNMLSSKNKKKMSQTKDRFSPSSSYSSFKYNKYDIQPLKLGQCQLKPISSNQCRRRKLSGFSQNQNYESNPCSRFRSRHSTLYKLKSNILSNEIKTNFFLGSSFNSPELIKRNQVKTLYDKFQRGEVKELNPDSIELIRGITPKNKQNFTDRYNIKGFLNSFSHIDNKIRKADISNIIEKLHCSYVPDETAKIIKKMNILDASISKSGSKVLRHFVISKINT